MRHLNTENTKYEEECATDDDNVADGLETGEESLDHQLEAGSTVDHSEGSESSDQSEHSQHPEEFVILACKDQSSDV